MAPEVNSMAVLDATEEYAQRITPRPYIFSGSTTTNIVIGRLLTNNIIVEGKSVSKRHARIEVHVDSDDIRYYIHDLGSKNGTFVNGSRIEGAHLLRDQDNIGLGSKRNMLCFYYPTQDCTATSATETDTHYQERDGSRLRLEGQWFRIDDNPLQLSMQEQRLLQHLYNHAGTCCSRATCAKAIWGDVADKNTDLHDHTLDVIMSSLRLKKLSKYEGDTEETKFIRTIRTQGYMLVLNPNFKK